MYSTKVGSTYEDIGLVAALHASITRYNKKSLKMLKLKDKLGFYCQSRSLIASDTWQNPDEIVLFVPGCMRLLQKLGD